MTGDGRPLSVRLHKKAGHLEASLPATAQDFHELADEVATLEAPCACGGGKLLAEAWAAKDDPFKVRIPEGASDDIRVRIVEVT